MDLGGLINLSGQSAWALSLLLATLTILYLKHKFSFWSKRGVKGPPWWRFGFLGYGIRKNWIDIALEYRQTYGQIYGFYEVMRPVISIGDLDLVRQVLVKEFNIYPDRRTFETKDRIMSKFVTQQKGEEWKRVRALLTPAFTSRKMRQMLPPMLDCVKDLAEVLAERDGQEVDMKTLWSNYTLDIIAASCFATRTNANRNADCLFAENIKKILNISPFKIMLLMTVPARVLETLGLSILAKQPMIFMEQLVKHLIEQRQNNPAAHQSDFLQYLVEMRNNNSANEAMADGHPTDKAMAGGQLTAAAESAVTASGDEQAVNSAMFDVSRIKNKTLDEDEILAAALLFFFAGYDTTGSLLNFASFLLATNPDVQEQLYLELKNNCQKNNELDHEAIVNNEFLDAVISETLRIYPPVIFVERESIQDSTLGGVQLPKGSLVQIHVYALHHDSDLFPEPSAFRPERFLPGNRDAIKPYSYLPFGAGPRNCIGMRFALLEAKLALARVVHRFRLVPTESTATPLKLAKGPAMKPEKAILLKVQSR